MLAAFAGDFTPTLDALRGGGGEAFFGTVGNDGDDAGDAELRGLFDEPLEAIELYLGRRRA